MSSLSIEVTYNIQIDCNNIWKVNNECLKCIRHADGPEQFIKLRAHEYGFVRCVASGHVDDLRKTQNLSIAQCPGYRALMAIRNQSAFADGEADDAGPSNDLFSSSEQKKACKGRQPRMKAAQLQALREHPETFEVLVPGTGDRPEMLIKAVKPVHPCDELCIKFDADTISHVVAFIQSHPIDKEMLSSRRSYKAESHGLWRNGSAGIVRPLRNKADEFEGGEVELSAKRFRTVKSADADESAHVLADGDKAEPNAVEGGA